MTHEDNGVRLEVWVRFEHDDDNTETALTRLQEDLMDHIVEFCERRDAYTFITHKEWDEDSNELTWRVDDGEEEDDYTYEEDEEEVEERRWN